MPPPPEKALFPPVCTLSRYASFLPSSQRLISPLLSLLTISLFILHDLSLSLYLARSLSLSLSCTIFLYIFISYSVSLSRYATFLPYSQRLFSPLLPLFTIFIFTISLFIFISLFLVLLSNQSLHCFISQLINFSISCKIFLMSPQYFYLLTIFLFISY